MDDRLSDWLTQSLRSGDDLDIAWRLIKVLVRRSPDDATLAFVAAGHLEDLVRTHGVRFADRLVEETRRDARFREAMRNVWGWEDVPAGLLERITPLLER